MRFSTAKRFRWSGSATNAALLALVGAQLDTVVAAFDDADFVELANDTLITHDR